MGSTRQFTSGPASPLIDGLLINAVGTGDATVSAKINPRGGQTTYHLEYGTTAAYGQSTAESAPFGFASDTGKHSVSVHIGGLEPGTAYHFRFVAENEVATTNGADTSFVTFPVSQSFAPCPNEEFRIGPGSRLPDCRAYEQGTPIDKHGANAQFSAGSVSPSGDRFTFLVNGGLPTSGGLSDLQPFLATRGPDGWSFDGLLPPTRSGFVAKLLSGPEDLSAALSIGQPAGGPGSQLFIRDSDTAIFQPQGPVLPEELFVGLVGFADGANHVLFMSEQQLLPSAPEKKPNLYDLDHGDLVLLDRVPAGSATSCDDEAGPACVVPAEGTTYGVDGHAISRDGSRVFFTSNPTKRAFNTGRIYMREGGRTTWISVSQRTTPDPNGEKSAELAAISKDGSEVFFLSCEKLTDDSTAHSTAENTCTGGSPDGDSLRGRDLYSYDVESGELTDLTVDSNVGDPLGAGLGRVLGTSEDGSYVYFTARGALAPGASNTNCEGKCNLYVYHDGVTKFIGATVITGILLNSTEGNRSRVSADGTVLLFPAKESLTGYDNRTITQCAVNGAVGDPCTEFFRYSAPEDELLCVSCLPTGIRPGGTPKWFTTTAALGSALFAGPIRNLSANGDRVFFESPDAMLPADTNGVTDVYEWEAKGEGSCKSESLNGGCLYLISSGSDPELSSFLGASTNGDHVFFYTEQKLVPSDEDQLIDVYDAAVGGGLVSQHVLAPPTCSTAACQSNPTPPSDQTPASATFRGTGNVHRATKGRKCPKGTRKVRRKGKASCKRAKQQHKRNNDRGGSK